MKSLIKGKKILLAVSGSIAAYKIATLIRLLVKEEALVKVVMTEDAINFITPLTLSTLSKNPVYHQFLKNEAGEWVNHVDLGLWADLMVIAPATAKTIAGMAHGYCDNLLVACYLSAKCPVMFAPAMDLDMYAHPSTKNNIETLSSYGNLLIPVGNGALASGLSGDGRMAEPEDIFSAIANHFTLKKNNKKVLITAGPTYENIDPVRFIGNYSSGKMGFALAKAYVNAGYNVDLIAGPVSLQEPNGLNSYTAVHSAKEMFNAVNEKFKSADICIMAAAVADYTPEEVSSKKIKKTDAKMNIALSKTTDILATIGKLKTKKQILVGFALESNEEEQNALGKLERKNLDMIILNSINDKGAGFQHNTNKVTIYTAKGDKQQFELKDKQAVANDILNFIETKF